MSPAVFQSTDLRVLRSVHRMMPATNSGKIATDFALCCGLLSYEGLQDVHPWMIDGSGAEDQSKGLVLFGQAGLCGGPDASSFGADTF